MFYLKKHLIAHHLKNSLSFLLKIIPNKSAFYRTWKLGFRDFHSPAISTHLILINSCEQFWP